MITTTDHSPFHFGPRKKLSLSQEIDFKIQDSQEIDPTDEFNEVTKIQSKCWRRRIQSESESRNANAKYSTLNPQILEGELYGFKGFAVFFLTNWRPKKRLLQSL